MHIKQNHPNIALLLQEATKNIENLKIIEQNVVISLYPFLCLLRLVLPLPS